MDFKVLGTIYNTDKISHHGYHRFYPKFLNHLREKEGSLLEIGINMMCSLKLWLDYFPNFNIYGIDIDLSYKHDRGEVFKCDQSNLNDVISILKDINFLFIIDDGSHVPEHQLSCFNYLFDEKLLDGGVYIIEDIETSYWKTGDIYGYKTDYGYQNKKSCIEIFKNILDSINNEFLSNDDKNILDNLTNISSSTRSKISTITFGHNCIIITKKTKEDYLYDNREYRFKEKI